MNCLYSGDVIVVGFALAKNTDLLVIYYIYPCRTHMLFGKVAYHHGYVYFIQVLML